MNDEDEDEDDNAEAEAELLAENKAASSSFIVFGFFD